MKKHNQSMEIRFIMLLALAGALFGFTGCLNSSAPKLGAVSGKVFDSNGHILQGAKVEIYGADHIVLTDELGRYYIGSVEPGAKRVVATWNGRSVIVNVEIPRGATLENTDITFTTVDQLPPIISDVSVAAVAETYSVITWKTDEPADSVIDYATGPIGLGTFTMKYTDSALVFDHVATLSHLIPNVIWHFRVRSRDYFANEGVSSEYQFSTPGGAPPEVPLDFALSAPSEMERVKATWRSFIATDSDLKGYNLYRSDSRSGPFARVNADPIPLAADASGTVATFTTYTDGGLKIGWKYYYYLKAVDIAMNESAPTNTLSIVTPGSLAENRVWKAVESPYILQGDLRVRGGAILTVEPGVEVKFSTKDSLPDSNGATMSELIVQGALMAVGNPENRIIFTSAETFPKKGCWGGLKFLSTIEPENQLKYITLLFADTGVRSEGSAPAIENSEFGLCVVGLDIGLSTALNPRYNVVRDCDIGLVSANSNIRNNLFIDNQVGAALLGADSFEHNTVDCLVGLEVPFGTPVIKNNIISYIGNGQGLYGINQTATTATPTISYNDIFGFAIPTNGLTVATGPGNIASDPLFLGGMPYDYHLQTVAAGYASDSPCLTAGENQVQQGRYGP
ncbi:MAG: hypothetical protein HQM10_07445 [Candidatus Riflebacteria bacterium]|nr:hypothetical protein [Candidatus Riflebacteria bacterium]